MSTWEWKLNCGHTVPFLEGDRPGQYPDRPRMCSTCRKLRDVEGVNWTAEEPAPSTGTPVWDGPPRVDIIFVLEEQPAIRVRGKDATDIERIRQWVADYGDLSSLVDRALVAHAERARESER